VDVSVAADRLTGGTVVVKLRPTVKDGQIPLSGVAPLTVRFWIERADQPGTVVSSGESVEELRLDTPECSRPLYLAEGLAMEAGTQLVLQVEDNESKEHLASIALTLVVPWE